MGCSNARLLVQPSSATETGARTTNPLPASSQEGTTPASVPIDTTTRMHLTGVDLIVERNGSYTLLLTPKTHKQLMPYVLRKKRFRILVDKPRSEQIQTSNDQTMDANKEINSQQNQINASTIEHMEQVASDEFNKTKSRLVRGRSIDRGNHDDNEEQYVHSDDEGMIEEIITTVEEDKDLECKVKKKIETKKTTSQHPETNSTITKVVKTEVTEITRTITINDHHDLERAKRELGIDDVTRLLPSSSSRIHQSTAGKIKDKQEETNKDAASSKDLPSDKQLKENNTVLAGATIVGRGPVGVTVQQSSSKSEQKPAEAKKKKKKSKLCSCTRAADDEHDSKTATVQTRTEQKIDVSSGTVTAAISVIDAQVQGQQLVSADIKQLIMDKKILLIDYVHTKIFLPAKLFSSDEQDAKAKKISSRLLDLLRYDRCSSWTQMFDQLADEHKNYLPANTIIKPMVNTYECLLTSKQSNLLNTFSTIHNESDIPNIQENSDYILIVDQYIHEQDSQKHSEVTTQQYDVTIETVEQATPKEHVEHIQETKPEEQVELLQQETPQAQTQQTQLNEQVECEQKSIPEEQAEQTVIDSVDEKQIEQVEMTNDVQQAVPCYNEEQLIRMLADMPQHKPITLAEAIAYEYIDIGDPKLGLSDDIVKYIKHLFRPSSDQAISNLVRVQRSGEHVTDINLAETSPFEKFNSTEPYIYQLQPLFEPTLDFNEKQFRSLTEAITNHKEQLDQIEFNIARTSLPIYDLKESSTNDFSQSDSGYSMTTATQDSLANKIKIEFEPIQQEVPTPPMRNDLCDEEKMDLDKATPEQLNRYELNAELIQIIKTEFKSSDKTVGQAILSRELRLDSADPNEIAYMHSLGIYKEQARILNAFFFPKHTRTIAYSPEPGRFVEAQTTYNPEYPGYKTGTTIIQIQDRQLSSEHLTKQRPIHDDRASPIVTEPIQEPEKIVPISVSEVTSTTILDEKSSMQPPTAKSAHVKKRKSTGSLLACFKSKKPKPGTEQQGQPTTVQPTATITEQKDEPQTTKATEEKASMDYAMTSDGKRIYIDAFRDRPGLDMSYKPPDFENRFVLPVTKPASEYERPITPEVETLPQKVKVIEHEPIVHLQPRSPVIEPVDVQSEKAPVVITVTKSDGTKTKKKPMTELHGAAVTLPAIELAEPGPLPTLPLGKQETKPKKVKKSSSAGLCASCFGKKATKKAKNESQSQTAQVPIEKKTSAQDEKKYDVPVTTVINTETAATTSDAPILPKVDIDQFRERTFEKTVGSLPPSKDQLDAAKEKITSVTESHHQLSFNEPSASSSTTTAASPMKDTSAFSKVNIDVFRERTFDKSPKSVPKPEQHADTTSEMTEPHYESPRNEPIPTPTSTKPIEPVAKDTSIFSQVNIDTFRERHFEQGFDNTIKPQTKADTTTVTVESHYESPKDEPIPVPLQKTPESTTKDTSIFSQVNIDTFQERNFEKGYQFVPKPQEHSDATKATVEPHYESPRNEPLPTDTTTKKATDPASKDASAFSQVNIDTFLERTFDKSPKDTSRSEVETNVTVDQVISTEEPHYQLPSSEPVPLPVPVEHEYSSVDRSTYDVPRTIELSQTTPATETKLDVQIVSSEPVTLSATIEKSSSDVSATKPADAKASDTVNVSVQATKTSKKMKKPKGTKKPNPLSSLLCHTKKKSKAPSLNLPPVALDVSPNTQLSSTQGSNADPLHIPSTDLPKLDIPLPTYERPEANMTIGQIKQTSDFAVPTLDLKTIPNLSLPEHTIKPTIEIDSEAADIPQVQLPEQTPVVVVDSTRVEPAIASLSSDEQELLIKPQLPSVEQTITITETNVEEASKIPPVIENKASVDLNFQLPSLEPIPTLSTTLSSIPPSFDDEVSPKPSPKAKSKKKQKIETKSEPRKKTSAVSLCSCFSTKSTVTKDKAPTIQAPATNLPKVDMPIAAPSISTTLKTVGPLRAPYNELPPLDLTPAPVEAVTQPTITVEEKKQLTNQIETVQLNKSEEVPVQASIPTSHDSKQAVDDTKNAPGETKKSPSFEIKVPALDIPELNLPAPTKADAYLIFSKPEDVASLPGQIPSRSDSGLEAIVSSHMHASSTIGTIATVENMPQYPSASSGLGSEMLKSSTISDIQISQPSTASKEDNTPIKYDFTRKISISDETRETFVARQDQLKKCLESEIEQSIENFDAKKDKKTLHKIITHAVDLVKNKKVSTYPELKQKLIADHKNNAFMVDCVVRSLYCTIEKQGLDNLDKPEFPLAIRDMVRLPAKQTYDTVTQSNKEETPLATTPMTNETHAPKTDVAVSVEQKPAEQKAKPKDSTARSCLTCGRSKSKAKHPSSTISSGGLLDERRRTELNAHRHELETILQTNIQSAQPAIRHVPAHSKETEKIIHKTLILAAHTKTQSYDQIRNELKTEYKQVFYIVDPIVDITRETLNQCDITQMNEKINLDILNSNISQTAGLYNSQTGLLTTEEHNAFRSNHLTWLPQYLIHNESKTKKSTRKQINELNKILRRATEILSLNSVSTWDDLNLQLQREFPKAHDQCHRSVELMKQSQKDGLFQLQQAPGDEKRRLSFLLTDRARQNLKANRTQIFASLKALLVNHNQSSNDENQLDGLLNKTLTYLEEQKQGQFKTYNDLKQQLKRDFKKSKQDNVIEQIVDVVEQAHATNQFDDIDKPEVQALMRDRLNGKPLVIKEMYVSLPPRIGTSKYPNEDSAYASATNGDRTLNNAASSHSVARGLSWREANERARILFYRGKHPAIHYDEKAAAFDVRMILETASGGTQEIPVTDSDVHELLNSCGVQFDGVNIVSLVDHSEDVVRAAEQAALRVIREKGIIDLRALPPSTNTADTHDDVRIELATSPDANNSSS